MFKEDCVEIFLRPPEDSLSYYGFELGALGTLYDYLFNFPTPHTREPNLDNILLKSSLTDTPDVDWTDEDMGWTLEIAIPWASLSMSINSLEELSRISSLIPFSSV